MTRGHRHIGLVITGSRHETVTGWWVTLPRHFGGGPGNPPPNTPPPQASDTDVQAASAAARAAARRRKGQQATILTNQQAGQSPELQSSSGTGKTRIGD
jgi:hypothetical protein